MLDFYVQRRNFGYGSGFISPDTKKFYVNIPKSASSFLSSWLFSSSWTSATVGNWGTDWDNIDEVIVVLRDPLERWVSGISQYMKGYIVEYNNTEDFVKNYTNITEKLIIDNLDIFDDHVWPQHCFFANILPNAEKKYYYIDSTFERKIKNDLKLEWPIPLDVDFNRSDDDEILRNLKTFFKSRIEKNNNLKTAIKNTYKKDYDIIKENCIF